MQGLATVPGPVPAGAKMLHGQQITTRGSGAASCSGSVAANVPRHATSGEGTLVRFQGGKLGLCQLQGLILEGKRKKSGRTMLRRVLKKIRFFPLAFCRGSFKEYIFQLPDAVSEVREFLLRSDLPDISKTLPPYDPFLGNVIHCNEELCSSQKSCMRTNIWKSLRVCFNWAAGILFSVPTSVPTTPDSNLVDECDDDQANCHSGTGDDFQLTGAETIFIPLPQSIPVPIKFQLQSLSCLITYNTNTTHACILVWLVLSAHKHIHLNASEN